MSHTIVGYCPRCGAPIYSPMVWMGVTPPPHEYTCACFYGTYRYTATGTNPQQTSIPVEDAGENHTLRTLVDVQEARIRQLEAALEKERAKDPSPEFIRQLSKHIDREIKKLQRGSS